MEAIYSHFIDFCKLFFNRTLWIVSILLGTCLSAIGYPKQVLVFIMTLSVMDIVTKHYSIVTLNYGYFSIGNYFRAWRDKNLTSRAMKTGLGIKVMLYSFVLYVAHQVSVLPEIMYSGSISNTLYTMVMLIETISISENFVDCGYKGFALFLQFFKGRHAQIFTNTQSIEGASKGEGNDELCGSI